MATLYVETFPDDLYEALRAQARSNRRSIAAETVWLIERMVPTPAELKRRAGFERRARQIQAQARARTGRRYQSAEELLREDRSR